MRGSRALQFGVLLLLGASGILVVLFSTASGTGLEPDSFTYLASAESLLSGNGLSVPSGVEGAVPSTHFPPLYPGLLAGLGVLGLDLTDAARWLNATLFGANTFLVGFILLKYTKGSTFAALLGSGLFLSSKYLILIHSHAWSEPAFYFFAMLGLFFLSRFISKPSRGFLVAATAAVALAFLDRYTGVTLAVAGFVSILWFSSGGGMEKARSALSFLLVSLLPAGLWMLRNFLVAGTLTDRMILYHPIPLKGWRLGLSTVADWILPTRITGSPREVLSLIVVAAGLAVLGLSLRRIRRAAHSASLPGEIPLTPQSFTLFIPIYVLFVIVSMTFIDAQTSLDARILSPVLVAGLIVGIGTLQPYVATGPRPVRWLALGGALLLAVFYLVNGWNFARTAHDGAYKGYAGEQWANSETLEWVRGLPDGTPIYTNGRDVLYLAAGRAANSLPSEIDPNTMLENEAFLSELSAMQTVLEEGNGVIVIFREIERRRWYLPKEKELVELLDLELQVRSDEGAVYRIAQ